MLSPPTRVYKVGETRAPRGPVHIEVSSIATAATRARLEHMLARAGLDTTTDSATARTHIRFTDSVASLTRPGDADTTLPADHPELYALSVREEAGSTSVVLGANAPAGIAMASRTLAQLWTDVSLSDVFVADWPVCPVRGVIEGFYGEPWTPEARAGMIRFLGAHKFNTFVYGPKDDVYHRGSWRDPYPEGKFAAVREQIRLCEAEELRFVYSLGPGLDIQYSSDADVQQILTKYRTLFDAGVRHFGLYFDDIPFVFLNEADIPVYGEATPDDITPLGVAQAEATTKVFNALREWDANCTLIFCPVEYWGNCESGYVRALRDGLPAEVDVFYTGPDICSARLETDHTRRVSERFGRPVTFWDNYPVNDAAMTGRLHINPIVGRDPDLFTAARGLISNPMTQCEASKLALATIGEYLWAPDAYVPDDAFARAVHAMTGDGEWLSHFRRFAENMYFCCLHETESEALHALFARMRTDVGTDSERDTAKAVAAHIHDLKQSCRVFDQVPSEALRTEMAPWVRALDRWTDVARAAVGVLQCPPERRSVERGNLEDTLKRLDGVKEESCGQVVAGFARWVLQHTA